MLFLRLFFSLFLLVSNHYVNAQITDEVRLADFEGTWYINMSNFPMWTKGKRQNPRIKYTLVNDNRMLDEVLFEKKGKTKQIVGYDERAAEYKEGFIWQGKGLKSLLSSKWKILHYNHKYQIAVLEFEKTLFTPAGYDVISRDKKLSTQLYSLIEQLLPKIGVKQKLTLIDQA